MTEIRIGGGAMHSIDYKMSLREIIWYYGKYVDVTRAQGKKPVSFLRFITGRF